MESGRHGAVKRSLIKIFSLLFLLTVVHITQTPAQAQANPCAGAPAPHLKTGIQVQITKPTSKDFPGAYLKAEPGRSGPVLRYLPVGTIVDVTDGPRCGSDKGYWWRVKLGDLAGWMAEVPVAGQGYGLEPPKAPPTATPLPSTVLRVLTCIQPVKPTATGTAPAAAAATEAAPAARLTRLVFATQEGYLQVSDNGGPSRTLVTFEPPPLALDLSPDGSAVLVVNYNGLYWVSVASGETVLVADATTFNLPESSWLSRVTWLPSGKIAAVEITTIQTDGLISYMLWAVSLDGSQPPFEADTGAQPADSVRRSPTGRGVIMLSSNDIAPFPKSLDDQSPSLLEFVPKLVASDPSQFVIPAITWAKDGTGFYTYIPASENAGPSDTVGGHLWYVGLNGSQTDVAKIPKVKATDYVIPSGDGQACDPCQPFKTCLPGRRITRVSCLLPEPVRRSTSESMAARRRPMSRLL
jgi:hypothetical protein